MPGRPGPLRGRAVRVAPTPMTTLPPDALFFALAAALAFAGLDLSQKWAARYAVPTPAGFLALRLLAGALVSPVLLLLPHAPPDWGAVSWSLVALLIGANLLGNVLYLVCVYRADISALSSLWPLKSAYLPLLAFVLPPRVVFPPAAYAWLLAATAGALLVAWNGRLRAAALTDKPVALMVFGAVPVFALSDYFFSRVVGPLGSYTTTVLVAWSLALLAVPPILLHAPSRAVVGRALASGPARTGALLTGVFLIAGVVCIGEAFARAGRAGVAGGFVLVNVFAMLSGVALLGVAAARPGWLEGESRAVYALRFVGAALLLAAAGGIGFLKP